LKTKSKGYRQISFFLSGKKEKKFKKKRKKLIEKVIADSGRGKKRSNCLSHGVGRPTDLSLGRRNQHFSKWGKEGQKS